MMNNDWPAKFTAASDAAWLELKARLALGQEVTGTVLARKPFGAFVDIGEQFPALLEIFCMAELTPDTYKLGNWCPEGSSVTAKVAGYREQNRQIALTQKN